MEEIANVIQNYGMSVVLMAYFLYKDFKFNSQITSVLSEIKEVLTELRTWHEVGDTK